MGFITEVLIPALDRLLAPREPVFGKREREFPHLPRTAKVDTPNIPASDKRNKQHGKYYGRHRRSEETNG